MKIHINTVASFSNFQNKVEELLQLEGKGWDN
jgi:hypothetical protein